VGQREIPLREINKFNHFQQPPTQPPSSEKI